MIIYRMAKTNIMFIRIDRYPDLKKELKKIMLELDIDSYAELLKLFADAYKENPLFFKDVAVGRKLRFID